MKQFTFIILSILILQSCKQTGWNSINVNDNISKIVDQSIIDTFDNSKLCVYEFTNKSLPVFYINDTISNIKSESNEAEWYETKWYTNKDTIVIVGSNVIHDGVRGFKANLLNNKSEIFAFVRTHISINNLGLNKFGQKYNAMLIPTAEHNLTINKVPNSTDSIIYGYAEFETEEFYTFENSDTSDYKIDNKFKYLEKIYFKANRCQNTK